MNTTPTDLERVGEALRAGGFFGAGFVAGCFCFQITSDVPMDSWDGQSEHPALAFAVMGILEAKGIAVRLERTCADDLDDTVEVVSLADGYICRAWPEGSGADGLMRIAPTRTEAVCDVLVQAHAAGLLSQGGGAQ